MRVALRLLLGVCIANAACSSTGRHDDTEFEPYDVIDAGPPVRDAGTPDASVENQPDAAMPERDADGDGLDDAWEASFDAPAVLSPDARDTDGDGTSDADEDPDDDGLTNLEEQLVTQRAHWPSEARASPVRPDILVELDCMQGRCLDDAIVRNAAAAHAALPSPLGLLVFLDEESIGAFEFDGSFEQRHAFFAEHGPRGFAQDFPSSQLVHMAVVTRRVDLDTRGGELVTDGENDPEKTGVLLFFDALDALHPACGVPNDAIRTPITLDDALSATLVHELGHALQLGHDTDVGGGVNTFNIMSVPAGCADAQERFHGFGNDDPALGATQATRAPRFSNAAAALINRHNRVSVDTGTLEVDTGHEM